MTKRLTGLAAGDSKTAWQMIALFLAAVAGLVAVFAGPATRAEAQAAASGYRFAKVADSTQDRFRGTTLGCPSINARGDVAFQASRPTGDGFGSDHSVVYRANAGGGVTTIANDPRRFDLIGGHSMNDAGVVSFAARRENGEQLILKGKGGALTTIATTAGRYDYFVFSPSINNAGRVAFTGGLDEGLGYANGLFSGRGGAVTTHYLDSTSQFDGSLYRPAINNLGEIAFGEGVNGVEGTFATQGDGFTTIAESSDPEGFLTDPSFNDAGTAAFQRTSPTPTPASSSPRSWKAMADRSPRSPAPGTGSRSSSTTPSP